MRSIATKCSVLVITVLLFSLMPFSALLATPEAKIGFAPDFKLNAKLPGVGRQFSFIHLTDLHIGSRISDYGTKGFNDKALPGDIGPAAENLREVVNWINKNYSAYNIKFVVITGDITDSAEKSEFEKAKEILDALEIPYIPLPGNHDIWPYTRYSECRLPVGDRYFVEVFSSQFENLAAIMPEWNDGTRQTPIWNQAADSVAVENEGCDSYFQNFAFDYAGYHFIFADFNSRNHNRNGRGAEPEGETYDTELCKGTLPWLKAHFESYPYKAAENMLMFWHHPLEADPHAFSTEEFNDIARLLGQKNNRDYSGLVCTGHYHKNAEYDISYGGEIICPGVETGAVMESSGNIRIFDVWGKSPNPQVNGAILFQEKDFTGRAELFVRSDSDLSDNFIGQQKIGSAREWGSIGGVAIYEKPDYSGNYLDISAEIENFEELGFAGGASSISIENGSRYPKPEISSMTPASALPGEALSVAEITGSNFRSGASVTLSGKSRVSASEVYVDSPDRITCSFDLKGAEPGSYSLEVTNRDGGRALKKDVFKVRELSGDRLYFAEGSTGDGFQEYLCLFNPNQEPVNVKATFISGSDSHSEIEYAVPPLSRYTIDVNETAGPEQELSVILDASGKYITADRVMYFDNGKGISGGHLVTGESIPSECWYFAEGTTRKGFDEWISVLNPNRKKASLTFLYTDEKGKQYTFNELVDGRSRVTYRTTDHLENGKDASLILKSSQPVIAERSIYFNAPVGTIGKTTGGNCSVGARLPAGQWYFAEGTTRGGFEEYLCLMNPNTENITVTAEFVPGAGQGEPVTKEYPIAPMQRKTLSVSSEAGTDLDISIRLSSESGFVAERPVYFNYKPDYRSWKGGHISRGATRQGKTWIFPEGNTGEGFEQWLCILNSNAETVKTRITFYFESAPPVSKIYTLEGNSRFDLPITVDSDGQPAVSTVVSADYPLVVESPLYFDYHGINGGFTGSGYCLE